MRDVFNYIYQPARLGRRPFALTELKNNNNNNRNGVCGSLPAAVRRGAAVPGERMSSCGAAG